MPRLLQRGVEAPARHRLRGDAHRRDPLPVAVVVRLVAVEQQAHEPALAPAPVDPEILGQERADDEPGAIVNPALALQLAHAGVDERVAGPSLAPGLERLAGAAPLYRAAGPRPGAGA